MEPSPHDLDCCLDRAALLTQEGKSVAMPATHANWTALVIDRACNYAPSVLDEEDVVVG